MSKEFRHIVRVSGTDLEGSLKLEYGLIKIKGVGINFSKVLKKLLNLDHVTRVGNLTNADIRRIEEFLENPETSNVPKWMLNRQHDIETGRNLHLIGSNLTLQHKSDIDDMREMRSWKGVRHSLGLKVRGQRTKTTARSGRIVGVRRKRARVP